jgi:hypothetical protein
MATAATLGTTRADGRLMLKLNRYAGSRLVCALKRRRLCCGFRRAPTAHPLTRVRKCRS